uniref:Glycoside hydrolase family 5 domain-containing protein n=1 Tax=Plectus sambesii TaxID=2011161 RepID=A0A914VJE0_9BILA
MKETFTVPLSKANTIQEQLDYLVYDEKYELDLKNLNILQFHGSSDYDDLCMGARNLNGAKTAVPVKKMKQSRAVEIVWCAALVASQVLALILLGISTFQLNCSNRDMKETTVGNPNVTWTTNKGHILLNGKQLVLKGINYFGFEREESAPHGLSRQSLDFVLDFMEENDFNAVRLHFSIEMVQKNPKTNVDCKSNKDICHLRALELMEAVIDRCAERGILVVLVCTQLESGSNYNTPNGLWYDDENPMYTEEKVLEAWDVLMDRVKTKWNLFALDVLDQPRHAASWRANNLERNFNGYSGRFVTHISSKHAEFKGFFFVEGVNKNGAFEGEDLMGESNFPKNMPSYWEKFYGFITTTRNNPVIVGSWGGKFQKGTLDETWHNAFTSWLQDKCLTNQFYFCLNGPTISPFGEPLLSDSGIPNRRKLDLLKKLQPHPTRLRYFASTSKLCITSGRFPNEECNL